MSPRSHLAEHELVDALEGTLVDLRAAHLAACPVCAATVDDLRAIAARASSVEVPEPPGFFWNQLSARVSSAVAEDSLATPRPVVWLRWPAFAIAAVILLAIGSTFTGVWPRRAAQGGLPPVATQASDADELREDEADIEHDEAWAVVRTLAEDLDHEQMDVEGVSAPPGSADHLTLGLSDPERRELARLLAEQLKGRTVPETVS
jgi:hypothetical protein